MFSLTKKMRVVLGFLCFGLLTMSAVSAQSLWTDSGVGANLFGDHRAHAVGDAITIVISENSSANRTGAAANAKTTSTSMDAGVGIFHGIAAASAANAYKFAATGSLVNSNVISGRMTAQVTEVKPNGDLVILGKQTIEQNGEEQTISVSGVVRIEDVAPDNTVLSSSINNAKIKIDGNGPLAGKQRQGIITRLFDFLF